MKLPERMRRTKERRKVLRIRRAVHREIKYLVVGG